MIDDNSDMLTVITYAMLEHIYIVNGYLYMYCENGILEIYVIGKKLVSLVYK
jgi:hypothetical protein